MGIVHSAKEMGFEIRGILHIGACFLEEAEEYQESGINHVLWVEAQPHNPARSEKAERFGHQLLEGCPLSDREENVTLHIANNATGSSSLLPLKLHATLFPEIVYTGENINLLAKRADSVFRTLPSELNALVLDVQGYELRVLKGMGDLLNQFQYLWVEVAFVELYEGAECFPEILAWLSYNGFKNHHIYLHPSKTWGDVLFWRKN